MPDQPSQPVTHVVFDVGGVLIRHVHDWREAHLRTQVPWDEHMGSAEFLEATRESIFAYMAGRITPEEWYRVIARASGGRISAKGAREVLTMWLYDEYPGVAGVIDDIHAAGLITGTLSNTNPVNWLQMLAAPSMQHIQHPYASHLLHAIKPDRAIFEAFERSTGFPRGSVLFFDDAPANIDTARAFGWRAELIDATGDPAQQLRDRLRRHGILP